MKKIFVDKVQDGLVCILGDEHKHLSIVLRAKCNDFYTIVDKNGTNYHCQIIKITKQQTTLKVINQIKDFTEPTIDVSLYFALLKGEATDISIRQAVELGVNKIIPFTSRYTVAQSLKLDRLNKIATQASQQCGRSKIPTICPIIDFDTMVKQALTHDLPIFLYEKATYSIKDYLKNANTYKNVAVIIGCEGGFSEQEVNTLISKNITPISMGKRILKADTASTTALSCVMLLSENL